LRPSTATWGATAAKSLPPAMKADARVRGLAARFGALAFNGKRKLATEFTRASFASPTPSARPLARLALSAANRSKRVYPLIVGQHERMSRVTTGWS